MYNHLPVSGAAPCRSCARARGQVWPSQVRGPGNLPREGLSGSNARLSQLKNNQHISCSAINRGKRDVMKLLLSMSVLQLLQQKPALSADAKPTPSATETQTTKSRRRKPDIGQQGLQEFIELTNQGKGQDLAALSDLRLKYGFRRRVTGQVQVRGQAGDWYDVRLDNGIAGMLVFRNVENGAIWVLEDDSLKQIDLSNDWIVVALFADGAWQQLMERVTYGSQHTPLIMGELEFRETLGVLSDVLDFAPEKPAASQ